MKKKLKKMLAPMTPSNEEVIKKSPKMALCQKGHENGTVPKISTAYLIVLTETYPTSGRSPHNSK